MREYILYENTVGVNHLVLAGLSLELLRIIKILAHRGIKN
jgi:hypothetical protein